MKRLILLTLFLALCQTMSFAQPANGGTRRPPPAFVKMRAAKADEESTLYNKVEYRIPMRDGIHLYCAVYVPKTADGHSPILMQRSPYGSGPYGADKFRPFPGSHKFIENKYVFAFEDVRGKYESDGQFMDVRPEDGAKEHPNDIDESTDTYDTIDYLIKNVPGNNGSVGIFGISYPGFYTACAGINSHPALKAISPQAPVSEWFKGDDFHHNGAFFVEDAFNFYLWFGQERPLRTATPSPGPRVNRGINGEYDFFLSHMPLSKLSQDYMQNLVFWNQMMNHGTFDDFWQRRSSLAHLKDVHCAVMTVGGFFDAEDMYGALHVFQSMQQLNPSIDNTIVMGPWFHGGWAGGEGQTFGDIDFGQDPGAYYRDQVEFPFFDHYLRGAPKPDLPKALMFETGSNKWDRFDKWPPKVNHKNLYLQAEKGLAWSKPSQSGEAADSYVSDPTHPDSFTAEPIFDRPREYMIADQRFNESKSDVLTYETQPLKSDLTVAGPLQANLFVTTTGTDSDFVVKVIDVLPPDAPDNTIQGKTVKMSNYEMLLRGDIFRGKFRNSFTTPEAFTPGKVTPLNFTLNDVCHTFKAGHRIMVQVQSSWFPLVDINPNKFMDIYHAMPDDFQKATIQIVRSSKYPSHIDFGVLQAG
ncbi:MAG TPA: CocE/NonD family hydrolase [Fimbriimonadaceae bacterium]|jgi:hypothetical protein